MNSFALFTDVSLNPRLKLGVGASLLVSASFLKVPPQGIERSEINKHLVLQRIENTSSTRLEVQTVLLGLEDYQKLLKAFGTGELRIYTDSQCVAGLLKRRPALEANDFLSKKTNSLLSNAVLYQRFYKLFDELGFEIIKLPGHSRSCSRDTIDCIFSSVDVEARKELKLWMNLLKPGGEPIKIKRAAGTMVLGE